MKTYLYLTFICLFSMTLFAADAAEETRAVTKDDSSTSQTTTNQVQKVMPEDVIPEEVKFEDIQLPEKGSPDYWVVRSDAVTELTRLLASKRSEMKKKRMMLADYLTKIGQAEAMASAKVEVPDDPKLYAQALGMLESYEQRNIALPNKLPTWEESAEFAMRFIIFEGHVPMQFDGDDDIRSFVDVCKKKEAYAQKVQREMRSYVKDCLKMWTYLGTINQQSAAKEWVVQMKLDAEKSKNAERAMLAEQRRNDTLARAEAEKDRKFQDAQDRASFRSSRRERGYESRNDRLQYQQTLLNERYTNHYRW
ncbi:MAG: hypothetical protein ACYSU8_03675 [Planctomycetota bacterium]|jgi:hypothetical protein